MQEYGSLARGEQQKAPNLGKGGDLPRWGPEVRVSGEGVTPNRRDPGRRRTCGLASHHHSPAPARLCPSSRRRLHIRYPGGRGLRGRGRTAWPPGASSAGDAAVASRGGGSKSAPAGELKAAAEVAVREMAAPPSPPQPQQPRVPHTGCTASSTRE